MCSSLVFCSAVGVWDGVVRAQPLYFGSMSRYRGGFGFICFRMAEGMFFWMRRLGLVLSRWVRRRVSWKVSTVSNSTPKVISSVSLLIMACFGVFSVSIRRFSCYEAGFKNTV